MDTLQRLSALIASQDASHPSAASFLAAIGTPSTSIAVLDHGTITSCCFSTVGDDENSLFQAASISKPMAALATLRLVAEDKLGLDIGIGNYLKDEVMLLISSPATRDLVSHITIRQLLSHTSGLSVNGFTGYVHAAPDLRDVLAGAPPANTSQIKLGAFPGQRFAYSGGGFTLLQVILEQVSGKSFAELMHELVFEPLGMHDSCFDDHPQKRHAIAHFTGNTPCQVSHHLWPEKAAAGLWTTPTDLLKAARAVQISLDATDDSGFLPNWLAQDMVKEVKSGMALSWFISYGSSTVFGHDGSNEPGFRCTLRAFADLKDAGELPENMRASGICIMTNSIQGHNACAKVVAAIAHLKRWELPLLRTWPQVIVPFHLQGDDLNQGWKDWIGIWGDDWEIFEHETLPVVRRVNMPGMKLLPTALAVDTTKDLLEPAIKLVVDGLDLLFILKKDREGKSSIDLSDGATQTSTTLLKTR